MVINEEAKVLKRINITREKRVPIYYERKPSGIVMQLY